MGRSAQIFLIVAIAAGAASAQSVDDGTIRLGGASDEGTVDSTALPEFAPTGGFDGRAFESRLESLWFQRKAYLVEGLEEDAARESEALRAFCAEEGLPRVSDLGGALLVEADAFRQSGRYRPALDSLALAERLDPGRSQTEFLRARVYWASGAGFGRTIGAAARGLGRALTEVFGDMRSLNRIGLVALSAWFAVVAAFAALMLWRHQSPIRHEIEEWLAARGHGAAIARLGGWIFLGLPLLLFLPAGWAVLFWLVVAYRFMWRKERVAAVVLLLVSALLIPGFRLATSAYGLAADARVRTTWSAASGDYDPQRIRDLLRLIEESPEDATLMFLLADTYRSGRYLEQAFEAYQRVLELEPAMWQAHVNLGNIYYHLGQHAEAIGEYQRTLALQPTSVTALYNMHVAQSASFQFKDAKWSLERAREIDAGWVSREAALREDPNRSPVAEARLERAEVWDTALGGEAEGPADPFRVASFLQGALNPLSILSLAAIVVSWFLGGRGREPSARKCIRCRKPFCGRCRRVKESAEYCSQCYHLFVAGDGLAAETKTKKLYEVECAERRDRRFRRLFSWILPGSRQVFRGAPLFGILLLAMWLAAWVALESLWWRPLAGLFGAGSPFEPLTATTVPDVSTFNPWTIAAGLLAATVWLAANAGDLLKRGRGRVHGA